MIIIATNSLYTNTEFGAEIPNVWEFRSKIELLSTRNLLCRKFAAVCRKTQNFLLSVGKLQLLARNFCDAAEYNSCGQDTK